MKDDYTLQASMKNIQREAANWVIKYTLTLKKIEVIHSMLTTRNLRDEIKNKDRKRVSSKNVLKSTLCSSYI